MEILKMWSYHFRVIYLTRVDGKYQIFYKSAGLNDSNSEGMVMPILRLKVEGYLGSSPDGLGEGNTFGWMPKAYMYNSMFIAYRAKQFCEFPTNMHAYMKLLADTDTSGIEEQPDPREINKYIADYIKDKGDYVDWKKHA